MITGSLPGIFQEVCSTEEPPLEEKGGGTIAACHFPLSRDEVHRQVAVGAEGGPSAPEDGPA